MFNERTYEILEAAVQEYIASGKPISSKHLGKKYGFGVKDATIRNELNNLTKEGFLAQPHTSGGRVPTNKGYQYLVGQTIENLMNSVSSTGKHINQLIDVLSSRQWPSFIDEVSHEMGLLGAGYQTNSPTIYKSGLDELFGQLELDSKNDFYEIARDFEDLDEKLKMIPEILGHTTEPQIFIGKKSPITTSDNLAVIIDGYNIGGERFYLAAIGSKRMDYQKNLKILKQIKESTKKHGRK
ncbi:MAG: hypothetical protein PHN74_00495 [Candidatus Pacebacteria bacterium]|nr:hypothetical protein [Candidatus Paceibacterota bacterium]